MPQLRSFTGVAGTPNLGSITIGGYQAGQSAVDDAAKNQIARSQIANQYAIAEMENSAQRAALQQRALMAAQELEVQKAEQQQRLGLASRELDLQEQKMNEVIQESMRQQRAQQEFRQMVASDLAGGKLTPAQAFGRAAAMMGPQVGLPGAAYPDPGKEAAAATSSFTSKAPKALDVEGMEGRIKAIPTSEGHFQLFDTDTGKAFVPKVAEHDPSQVWVGKNRLTDRPEEKQAKSIEKEIDKLEAKIEGKEWEAHREAKFKDERLKSGELKGRLSAGEALRVKTYDSEVERLENMKKQVEALRSSLTNAPMARFSAPADMGTNAPSGTNAPAGIKILSIREKQ